MALGYQAVRYGSLQVPLDAGTNGHEAVAIRKISYGLRWPVRVCVFHGMPERASDQSRMGRLGSLCVKLSEALGSPSLRGGLVMLPCIGIQVAIRNASDGTLS